MKKLLILSLTILMAVGLTACASEKPADDQKDQAPQGDVVQEDENVSKENEIITKKYEFINEKKDEKSTYTLTVISNSKDELLTVDEEILRWRKEGFGTGNGTTKEYVDSLNAADNGPEGVNTTTDCIRFEHVYVDENTVIQKNSYDIPKMGNLDISMQALLVNGCYFETLPTKASELHNKLIENGSIEIK